MSNEKEAEKAARECGQKYKDRESENYPYSSVDIAEAVEVGFEAGVEWERKRLRDKYCPSYVLAPTMANQGEANLCHVIPVNELKQEGGE